MISLHSHMHRILRKSMNHDALPTRPWWNTRTFCTHCTIFITRVLYNLIIIYIRLLWCVVRCRFHWILRMKHKYFDFECNFANDSMYYTQYFVKYFILLWLIHTFRCDCEIFLWKYHHHLINESNCYCNSFIHSSKVDSFTYMRFSHSISAVYFWLTHFCWTSAFFSLLLLFLFHA